MKEYVGYKEMRELLEAFCSLTVRDVLDYAAFCFAILSWTGVFFILAG